MDLDKTLINIVKIGRLKQKVMYEGIGSLCFCCGRIGHEKENYYYQILPKVAETVKEDNTPTSPKLSQVEDTSESNYGSWMIVTRRRDLVRNGRTCGLYQPTYPRERVTRGNRYIQEKMWDLAT